MNIEFAGASKMAAQAQELAWAFKNANERYATDYPAVVGNRMSNTDSAAFQDLVASISLREAERLSQVGAGWDPTWHQPIDVLSTFSDKRLPPRPERRADDPGGRRATSGRDGQVAADLTPLWERTEWPTRPANPAR